MTASEACARSSTGYPVSWRSTPSGAVEAVNRQILEYCGQSLDELKNWGTNGTVHPERPSPCRRDFHAIDRLRHSLPDRAADAAPRRRISVVDTAAFRFAMTTGTSLAGMSLLTDIEDRTQALARLQQMQSDFAHINRLSMMGELAASLSHEILHPIATARNNARAGMRFLEMSPPNLDEVQGSARLCRQGCGPSQGYRRPDA